MFCIELTLTKITTIMPYSPNFYYNSNLKDRARDLRQKGTLGEALLWKALQKKQVLGLRFLRQRPLGPFIVDFFCPTLRLVVEVDGASHVYKEDYDQRRQLFLESRGMTVLRVQEVDVRNNIEGVVEMIRGAARRLGADS